MFVKAGSEGGWRRVGSGSGPCRVALAWSPREFWSGSYVSELPRLGSKRWVKGVQREPKDLG